MDTSVKEFKKKLIYTDEKALNNEIENRKKLNSLIKEFLFYLKDKGINPEKEHVKLFIEQGIPFIHSLLIQDAKAEIDRLKINSASIRQNMLSGMEKQAKDFEGILKKIRDQKNKCYGLRIENIIFNKNEPVLTENDIKNLKEQFSIYLENEKQADFYKSQCEFAEAFNKFEKALIKNGYQSLFSYGEPKRLNEYIKPELKKGVKPNESNIIASIFPRFGGVDIKANPLIFK